jgi:hypothetical protein
MTSQRESSWVLLSQDANKKLSGRMRMQANLSIGERLVAKSYTWGSLSCKGSYRARAREFGRGHLNLRVELRWANQVLPQPRAQGRIFEHEPRTTNREPRTAKRQTPNAKRQTRTVTPGPRNSSDNRFLGNPLALAFAARPRKVGGCFSAGT